MNSFFVIVLLACFGQFAGCLDPAENKTTSTENYCDSQTTALIRYPEEFVITKNQEPQATILVSDKASEGELLAANELQSYILKSSGGFIPMKKDDEDFCDNAIAIGRNKINITSNLDLDRLGREGFRIKTNGNVLSLVGKDDAGTQFAVYTFLEKYLGIRWFWPGELGEVVPRMETIEVGKIDDTEEPDFKWRNRGPGGALWGSSTGPTEMHARELLLGVSREHQREVQLWEKRNKWGGMKIYGGHVLGEIFTPAKYAETHPEYYALVNGKRRVPGKDYDYKHGGQICTSNPEVIKVTVEWVRDFFDKHPDYDAVHITMNDGLGFCECASCRALDSGEAIKEKGIDAEEAAEKGTRDTSITDRIFTFANQVAQEVQKTHPGKYVVNLAYSRYITPPKFIKLHPFVILQYCLWSAYRHANADIRKGQEEIAAGWAKAAKRKGIYEYYINGSWPSLYRLIVPHIAQSIRYLYKQGYDLYQTQSGDEFGINGINYYVAGKLLWDTSLDEQKILDDSYQKAFGPAGSAIRRFHSRLEDAWTKVTIGGGDIGCNVPKCPELLELFTPQLLENCRQDLAEAQKAADNDMIRRRIEFYRKGLRYTEMTVDVARTSMKIETLGIDLSSLKRAKQNIGNVNKEEAKKLVAEALAAWQKRDSFVEELKNDYVLAYFWVKYNERRFNPSEILMELSKILESE
jgi:hypothetical protein